LSAQCMEIVRTKDTGTLQYDIYFNDDQSEPSPRSDSTDVPGLATKPIIDLDVVILDRADLPAVIKRLRALGYHHESDLGVPGREAFTTPAGAPSHRP
jgi:GrpB protein